MEYLHPMGARLQRNLLRGRARRWDADPSADDNMVANITMAASGQWSLSCWIKPTDAGPRTIFGVFNGAQAGPNDGCFRMLMTSGEELRAQILQDVGTGDVANKAVDIHDGNWHLVGASISTSVIVCWVDGSPGTSVGHSRSFPTITKVGLGFNAFSSPDSYWLGDIDEATILDDHFWTDQQMSRLYTLGMQSSKVYFTGGQFNDAIVAAETTPTAHYRLSVSKNPTNVGKDEVGSVDLTDNGTEDIVGIPAPE